MIRKLLVALIWLVLAVTIVRDAAVMALGDESPSLAAKFWSSHPNVERSLGMTEIATASRNRTFPPSSAFSRIYEAAARDPLAPEPYLVRGVQLQQMGDQADARRAFLAGEWRDPRAVAARYFAASSYFRAGDITDGLRETGALARLVPNGPQTVAPSIAQYAGTSSNWRDVRLLFRSNVELEDPTLTALAANPANADAVLALADPEHRGATSPWLQPLLTALIGARQYTRARAIWASVSHAQLSPGQLIYDPAFTDEKTAPPFNWTLTASAVGVAERQPGGLYVIFYGKQDGVLASQLLTLPPGTYRAAARLSADDQSSGSLSWSISCIDGSKALSTATLDALSSGQWSFTVPAACGAQNLQLWGRAGDAPIQSQATISRINLQLAS